MLLRFLGIFLLFLPFTASAADRGPSTPAERKQALEYIHRFQADPLNPDLTPEIQWVVKWTMAVPDIRLDLCTGFFKLTKAGSKDGQTLFNAMVFAQTAYLLENSDGQTDKLGEIQAGVEGVLHVYEVLLKASPKDRQPDLDKLIKQRDKGMLAKFVELRATSSCNI
ncbi:MAG: hypothetical protein ABR987_17870 [Terracidiphilus sp.]